MDTTTHPSHSHIHNKTAAKTQEFNHSAAVSVDPNGQLSTKQRREFMDISKRYSPVFSPQFTCYNEKSGTIRANINMGPVEPPPRKGKIPLYNHSNLQHLQLEADKLEELVVLAKPEDVGVDVKFVSPSFLVTKPTGGFRFQHLTISHNMYDFFLPHQHHVMNSSGKYHLSNI